MISVFNQSQNNINNSNNFVRLTNMGGYIAFYTLFYLVDGKLFNFLSPLIPVLQSHTMIIPQNAVGIYIEVDIYILFNVYKIIGQLSIEKSGKICLTSYGTIFKGWVERTPC